MHPSFDPQTFVHCIADPIPHYSAASNTSRLRSIVLLSGSQTMLHAQLVSRYDIFFSLKAFMNRSTSDFSWSLWWIISMDPLVELRLSG